MSVLSSPPVPSSVPLPPSPSLHSPYLPPSPPASPPLHSDSDTLLPAEDKDDLEKLLPPTFKMIPPTPLTPGEDERFASPELASFVVDDSTAAADESDAEVDTPQRPSVAFPSSELVDEGDTPVPSPPPVASTDLTPTETSPAAPPAMSTTSKPKAVTRKISILGFNIGHSKESKEPSVDKPKQTVAAQPDQHSTRVAASGTTAQVLPSAAKPASPAIWKAPVVVPTKKPSGSSGGGLAGVLRSLTRKKADKDKDGAKGGLLARGRSVLEARHEQTRLEQEAEATRTAERRHREASHLLGQPLKRSPSSGLSDAAVIKEEYRRVSSELTRSRSRDVASPGGIQLERSTSADHLGPTPGSVVIPPGNSRHRSQSRNSASPSRNHALPIVSEDAQRRRPPPLHISINARSSSTPANFSSSMSSVGTPASTSADEEAAYVRSRQKRLHDSVTTPPALSHSPTSYDGHPSADYLSKIDRRGSPQTPVEGTGHAEFGSVEEGGKRGRVGKAFGSLSKGEELLRSRTVHHQKKRSSSTGPNSLPRTRTSASPMVISRAEVAAKVSQASEQDQRDVDTFFSL